ncbi:MAG: protein TolR [Proteobacteria bacterium]|nr:protein TolR [Pseudomonadota bacterium]
MASEFLSRSGSGGRRRGSYKPLSEINVTPFVDVMLVLLIVFMITAPLMTVGVPVDLPKVKAKSIAEAVEPLVITVNAEGAIFIQDTEVELENLVPRLAAITDNKPDTRIYLRGDKSINYGRVLEVMGTINVAGFTRVALVAELPKGLIRKARKRKTDE